MKTKKSATHAATRIRSIGLMVIAATLVGCGGPAVDERLVGSWQTTTNSPQGQWTLVFTANPNGSFRTEFHGPYAAPADTGEFEADDGTWRMEKAAGAVEEGTYEFLGPNQVVLNSSSGVMTWTRAVSMASPAPNSPFGVPPQGAPGGGPFGNAQANTANPQAGPFGQGVRPQTQGAVPNTTQQGFGAAANPSPSTGGVSPGTTSNFTAPQTPAYSNTGQNYQASPSNSQGYTSQGGYTAPSNSQPAYQTATPSQNNWNNQGQGYATQNTYNQTNAYNQTPYGAGAGAQVPPQDLKSVGDGLESNLRGNADAIKGTAEMTVENTKRQAEMEAAMAVNEATAPVTEAANEASAKIGKKIVALPGKAFRGVKGLFKRKKKDEGDEGGEEDEAGSGDPEG